VIKNIIFDLDGLLADTERLHIKSYVRAFTDHGIELTPQKYQEHWIRNGLGVKEYIAQFNLPYTVEELHNHKHQIFLEYAKTDLLPMPYAKELLETVKKDFRLFVASNSYMKNVKMVLSQLDMLDYFEALAARETVPNLKPSPDIYLYLAEEYNFKPEETVVLEDAQKGIDAAYAAGMKSIAVPTQYTSDNDFSKADKVVESLGNITTELIKQL